MAVFLLEVSVPATSYVVEYHADTLEEAMEEAEAEEGKRACWALHKTEETAPQLQLTAQE